MKTRLTILGLLLIGFGAMLHGDVANPSSLGWVDPDARLVIDFNAADARDWSQYGNNGVITNASYVDNTGAWVSNGANTNYVAVANPASLSLDLGTATDFTILAWVNLTSGTATNATLISKGDFQVSAIGAFRIFHSSVSGKLRLVIDTTGALACTCEYSDLRGAGWKRLCAVFRRAAACTAAQYDLYLNGVVQTGTIVTSTGLTNANVNNAFPLYVGQSINNAAFVAGWNGSLDDVWLIFRAYTAAEAAADYDSVYGAH